MRRAPTLTRTLETDLTRGDFCPSCQGTTQTVTQRNRDGNRYSPCLTCARRFRAA